MDTQENSDDVRKRVNFKNRITMSLHRDQELINPCYKEHLLSLKCLDSNQKDHNMCETYFVNYKNCKNFWAKIQLERRSKGIKPYLPPPEERAKIKADFLNSRGRNI